MGWLCPRSPPRDPDPPARPPGHGPRVKKMPDEIANPAASPEQTSQAEESGAPGSAVSSPNLGSSPVEDSSGTPFSLEPKPVSPAPDAKRTASSKDAKEKEKEEASQSPFSVTVGQVYDGPLDLLLDLIRKQNIDIYDIPIARITSQFLEYTHHLKQVDVDSAGEFIYMASLLIHIKSKTLLPRDSSDVLGGESED